MDKHFDYATTPLKYHNFLRFFAMPVGLIIIVVQLFNIAGQYNSSYGVVKSAFEVDLFFYGLTAVTAAITLYGFYTWKPCGYYGIFAYHGVSICYSLVCIVLFTVMDLSDEVYDTWVSLISELVVAIPVFIYYGKRRPLFFEELRLAFYQRLRAENTVIKPQDKSMGDPSRCRVCGEKLNPGRTACMKCGAAVPNYQEEQDATANKPRYCTQCGKSLEQESKFCPHCGAKQN